MIQQHQQSERERPDIFVGLAIIFIFLTLSGCAKTMSSHMGSFATGTVRNFEDNVGKIVRFTTDSAKLTERGKATLKGQALWLKRYAQYSVTLEGHADERGTREYNIALGARRADTVRRFLITRGIKPARIRTISYGKERPVALCDNISCWSQNRRVVTILNVNTGS